jgi:hypothetical protein
LQALNKTWSSSKNNLCANFFLQYLNKKYSNFWISLTLAGYLAGYPVRYPVIRPHRISGRISGRAIWYPAGHWISKKAGLPAGYPVHPYLISSVRPDIRVPCRISGWIPVIRLMSSWSNNLFSCSWNKARKKLKMFF